MDSQSLALYLTKDLLVSLGLKSTLESLQSELSSKHGVSLPGSDLWFSFTRASDYNSIEAQAKTLREANNCTKGNPSALENCLEYLLEIQGSKIREREEQDRLRRKANILASVGYDLSQKTRGRNGSQQHTKTSKRQQGETKHGGAAKEKTKEQRKGSDQLDQTELSALDEALALEHTKEKDLYTISTETLLNETRFRSNIRDITRRHNVSHGIRYETPHQAPSESTSKKVDATSLEESSSSVAEMTRKVVKGYHEMLASKNSPNRSDGASPSFGFGYDSNASTRTEFMNNNSNNNKMKRKDKRRSFKEWDSQEELDNFEEAIRGDGMIRTNSMPMFRKQQEKRMNASTQKAAMKILGRDIKVGILNADFQLRLEKERLREKKRISEEEQILLQEKYCGRKRRHCALCEKDFSIVNLPLSISFKAVLDVRRGWGSRNTKDSHLARAPRCYDEVRVCVFCSQFFDDVDRYRPEIESEYKEQSDDPQEEEEDGEQVLDTQP